MSNLKEVKITTITLHDSEIQQALKEYVYKQYAYLKNKIDTENFIINAARPYGLTSYAEIKITESL